VSDNIGQLYVFEGTVYQEDKSGHIIISEDDGSGLDLNATIMHLSDYALPRIRVTVELLAEPRLKSE